MSLYIENFAQSLFPADIKVKLNNNVDFKDFPAIQFGKGCEFLSYKDVTAINMLAQSVVLSPRDFVSRLVLPPDYKRQVKSLALFVKNKALCAKVVTSNSKNSQMISRACEDHELLLIFEVYRVSDDQRELIFYFICLSESVAVPPERARAITWSESVSHLTSKSFLSTLSYNLETQTIEVNDDRIFKYPYRLRVLYLSNLYRALFNAVFMAMKDESWESVLDYAIRAFYVIITGQVNWNGTETFRLFLFKHFTKSRQANLADYSVLPLSVFNIIFILTISNTRSVSLPGLTEFKDKFGRIFTMISNAIAEGEYKDMLFRPGEYVAAKSLSVHSNFKYPTISPLTELFIFPETNTLLYGYFLYESRAYTPCNANRKSNFRMPPFFVYIPALMQGRVFLSSEAGAKVPFVSGRKKKRKTDKKAEKKTITSSDAVLEASSSGLYALPKYSYEKEGKLISSRLKQGAQRGRKPPGNHYERWRLRQFPSMKSFDVKEKDNRYSNFRLIDAIYNAEQGSFAPYRVTSDYRVFARAEQMTPVKKLYVSSQILFQARRIFNSNRLISKFLDSERALICSCACNRLTSAIMDYIPLNIIERDVKVKAIWNELQRKDPHKAKPRTMFILR